MKLDLRKVSPVWKTVHLGVVIPDVPSATLYHSWPSSLLLNSSLGEDRMKTLLRGPVRGLLALAMACPVVVSAQTDTAKIVAAADNFLATLTAEQRQKVLYSFDDAQQRARWSNFPTGFVPRGGISLKQMTVPQQSAAMNLLATVLSPMGLEKVNEIREADDDFKANGSKRGPRGAQGGRPPGPPPGGQMALRPAQMVAPEARRRFQATICSEAVSTTSRF